ncbi:NAD(P)-binding protein [Aspergillus aculeatinus CBS 121060]|uniref:NAD(P)-binding protein n=1 Tax=Aspergillus aculeatinus CBS 121060 TaxID=1448322 RepID=A0ACD1H412_9EURO|nr:NAD(P)-binding protein [Aspergillus aculeatinus CBS 121060]RAH68332.1 NAD(P)-binding protein [Aspergillus aculeatinus CBS 121060]
MKVAIVGTGCVARYVVDALLANSHDVITLSRTRKQHFESLPIVQYEIEYTAKSMSKFLEGCEAVICTVSFSAPDIVQIHRELLEACKSIPTCKKLFPSIWIGNFEDVPDQPYGEAEGVRQIASLLSSQNTVEWTIVSLGWLIDYVLPTEQRYLPDDPFWVQDHEAKTFKLYGSGTQTVSCTPARDAANAVVRLAETEVPLERVTYMSGQQLTWAELYEIIKERDPGYTLTHKSLAECIQDYINSTDEMAKYGAVFDIMGHSEALKFPQPRVDKHREIYFTGLKFRTVKELLDEGLVKKGQVV